MKFSINISIQKSTHKKFERNYGGKVFYIVSIKKGNKKVIHNTDVIKDIQEEIERLSN